MRKVKFTQDTFDEKLGAILSEFPMLDVYRHFTFVRNLRLTLTNAYRTCIRFCPLL